MADHLYLLTELNDSAVIHSYKLGRRLESPDLVIHTDIDLNNVQGKKMILVNCSKYSIKNWSYFSKFKYTFLAISIEPPM